MLVKDKGVLLQNFVGWQLSYWHCIASRAHLAPHNEMRVGGEEIRSEFLADLFEVSIIQLIHYVPQSLLAKTLK